MKRGVLGILALASLAVSAAAQAQTLRDPTRPPGAAAAARGVPGSAASGDMVLQSILLSPERRAAIISGRVVQFGESVDGYRLVAIGEGEAVLRMGSQVRTLRLYPSVDLRVPAVAAGDAAPGSRDDIGKSAAKPVNGG